MPLRFLAAPLWLLAITASAIAQQPLPDPAAFAADLRKLCERVHELQQQGEDGKPLSEAQDALRAALQRLEPPAAATAVHYLLASGVLLETRMKTYLSQCVAKQRSERFPLAAALHAQFGATAVQSTRANGVCPDWLA